MKFKIIEAIESSFKKLNIQAEIELTPSKKHGDFSTNVPMKLASQLGDSPRNIAKKIIQNIELEKFQIEKIEIAGPGFINFFVKKDALNYIVKNVLTNGDNFGQGNQCEYINVEYVSANPTGYLHLGHARGAAIGSTLVNILRFAGNKVDAEYYVNDAGGQINILGVATYLRYKELFGEKIEMPENTYMGKDIIWVAKKLKEEFGDKFLNGSYGEFEEEIKTKAKDLLLEQVDKDLKDFKVYMDFYSSEKKMYEGNIIKETLQKINDKYEHEGATWLKTTKFGDDKDRVLIKKDGTYTYLTPDIAYHNQKLSRGYDYIINIWGADHISYIKRMSVALQQLGYKKEVLRDVLVVQMVRLIKDGQELKMSKRLGTSFTIRELIELTGSDVARFFMLNKTCDSKFDFNVNQANEESSNNPIYYIQYAHARINQILEKSNIEPSTENLNSEGAKELLNLMSKFPEIIIKIANNRKVHLLTTYTLNLAKAFHSYYNKIKIIDSNEEASKLAIIKAVKQVLKNALTLLGISAPERM